jgi:cytoskeletal protein CcmA (bactofilin family)
MLEKKAEGKLDTVIGKGCQVTGELKIEGGVRIDGQLDGKLQTSDLMVGGPSSFIKGEVRCKEALVGGRVEGNIYAGGQVELQPGAHLVGDITCRGLVIHSGAFFEGRCQMSERKKE